MTPKQIAKSLLSFFQIEAASGIVLAFAAIAAFVVANSSLSEAYFSGLATEIFGLSVRLWVNDGLMAIFFFVVGLEIKKELVLGHLSSKKQAALPVAAAVGGMICPALIYLALNHALPEAHGWGIPMATDIAFAVGVLTLLGPRVPLVLKVFLLAVAIIDDLGAILVIAFFYTSQIKGEGLALAMAGFVTIFLLRYMGLRSYIGYTVVGIVIWFGFFYSGVHATVAGVLLGLLTPISYPLSHDSNETYSPLEDLIQRLHGWVSYAIMPIFAFANAGVDLRGANMSEVITHPVQIGVALGLFFGKPIGIMLASLLTLKLGISKLPNGLEWRHIVGVGFVAGIGFTMSLFISSLALPVHLEIYAKTGIVLGSLLSMVVGSLVLKRNLA